MQGVLYEYSAVWHKPRRDSNRTHKGMWKVTLLTRAAGHSYPALQVAGQQVKTLVSVLWLSEPLKYRHWWASHNLSLFPICFCWKVSHGHVRGWHSGGQCLAVCLS